jgi:hypothetical protein
LATYQNYTEMHGQQNHKILHPGTFKAAVLNLWSVDIFQGGREIGWENNYKFIFINLELKVSFPLRNECRQQSNLWPIDFTHVCFLQ